MKYLNKIISILVLINTFANYVEMEGSKAG